MKRMLFFLGKGGVGKSTISSTAAYRLALNGYRVLIISLDPAHNLGDIYEMELSDKRSSVIEGLDAIEIDLQYWVQHYLKSSRDEIISNYNYNLTINLDSYINILKYSPGTEEYAVLWAIESLYDRWHDKYDYIVFDTPPTALTLRFLAMPSITRLWVGELSAMREKILKKRQTLTRLNPDAASLKGARKKEDDKVSLQLGAISSRLEKLYRLFTEESYVSVVINDDKLSIAESERIRTELGRLHITLNSLCLNKVLSLDDPHEAIERTFAEFPIFKFISIAGGITSRQQLGQIYIDDLIVHIQREENPQ
ncbi:ArsA family ATPase [Sediminispirochaeta bajacaliforniensis]|uniref:ArsA family ATPase n=1 Tax=Sediminispirochaeta bajacaliforniensis TaxID=148 RepID=UPI00037EA4E9|nr:ArsA family ATPase [Sediminispirochaeta bajacaliforniensis]